jgi:hypothetical protein
MVSLLGQNGHRPTTGEYPGDDRFSTNLFWPQLPKKKEEPAKRAKLVTGNPGSLLLLLEIIISLIFD